MASREHLNGQSGDNKNSAITNGHGHTEPAPFEVAIIGGGVVGLCMAVGLVARNIPVTVYEQAAEIHVLGVGLGFTKNTMACLHALDPRLTEAVGRICTVGEGMRWVDGTRQEDVRLRPEEQMADFELHDDNFIVRAMHRAHLMEALSQLLPKGCIKFGKRLVKLEQNENTGKVSLGFGDGETVEADAVLGCDGVKSYVRRAVVGESDPSAVAHFSGETAWRCLLDMEKAAPIMGKYARQMFWWQGPGAHMVSYPVSNYKFVNVAAYLQMKEPPAGMDSSQTVKGRKKDAVNAFANFGPLVRGLVDIFPEEASQWLMFDTLEHPLRSFAFGLVALAGDAAHPMCPHHGQGAGMGIEDSIVVATLLEQCAEVIRQKGSDGTEDPSSVRSTVLKEAFKAYNGARHERAQWVVWSSRRQGVMQKWGDPDVGRDSERMVRDTRERFEKTVNHDCKGMVDGAVLDLEERLRGAGLGISA